MDSLSKTIVILVIFFLVVFVSKTLIRFFKKNPTSKGEEYNPAEDGMESDTGGDEWDKK